MTELQSIMLAICCGYAVGHTLGELFSAAMMIVDLIKDKRRNKM